MTMDVNLSITGDIQRLHLEPDDVVVVRVHRRELTLAEAETLKEQVIIGLGVSNRVVVTTDEVELSVLEKASA